MNGPLKREPPPAREQDLAALLELGSELADANRHDDAVACFRQAADMGSRDAWFNLGNSLSALHRVREAADAHRAAAELGVDDAWLNLGNLLSELGNADGAVAA